VHPGDAEVVGLDREAGQDRLHADGSGLAACLVRALDADQELHGGDRGDRGVVQTEEGVDVERASFERDEDAGVEDYSPGHPRTSSLKAEPSSA
jgi:hypothetical protein